MKISNLEEFRAVVGYEELYEVSNLGNVKSLSRDCIMKPTFRKDRNSSYAQVILKKDGKRHTKYIHNMVAEAFLERIGGQEVSHLDGNKKNNSLFNLTYEARKENIARKVEHKTASIGRKHPLAKLCDEDIATIKDLYATGEYTQRNLAKSFDTCQSNISFIVNDKTWQYPESWSNDDT